MTQTIKRALSLLLCAAMTLSLAACGRSREDTDTIPESTGGRDVVRTEAADKVFSLNSNSKYSFNPLIATSHANQLICDLVFENMVELDGNFEVIEGAGLIQEYSCDETGKVWTFTVATDHVFHDGTPVSAKDLSYSINLAINADRFRGRFSSFQGASYWGEDQLTVTLGIGDTQFVKLLNIPVIKLGSYGRELENGMAIPMGSGPYTFSEDGTKLLAYKEGYEGYRHPPVDTIYIVEYADAESTISAFEDGLIDVVVNDPSSYTNLGYASSNEIHNYPTTNMHYLCFNEDSVLGRYSQFRIALQYAFDRDYLVELLHGNAVSSALPMYPTCSAFSEPLNNSLSFNMDTCKRILESAGVRDYDEDGQLEYMSGTPQEIEFTVVVCADSSAKAGIVRKFQEDMASIGFPVTVMEMTWENYMKALEDGEVEVGSQVVTVDMYYAEVRLRNNFDITEILQPRTKDNESKNLNYTGSTDTSVVDRINTYLAASNAQRPTAFYELCTYLTGTTGTLITIGFEKQQIISRRGVCKGIDANIGNPLWNFSDWTIDLG
ncbi:MAG: ABC transporter substrate-binding protein [Oscillospiraceae bacterium]|nr:ABC transporter substrate-binding protein [Oscillospiraceae bacterium]